MKVGMKQMELRAIRTDKDLDWALSEVEQYFDEPPEPGTEESEHLNILTDLIEAYEDREYPIDALDPIETLKVFMVIKNKDQSDLAQLIGGKSGALEILNRKRPLTLRMIQQINSKWKIPAESLIAPYRLDVSTKDEGRKSISYVEVLDTVLWVKHIRGNEALKNKILSMSQKERIKLEIDGWKGTWIKMDDGMDLRPTPGLKAEGVTLQKWLDMYEKRGTVVSIKEVKCGHESR